MAHRPDVPHHYFKARNLKTREAKALLKVTCQAREPTGSSPRRQLQSRTSPQPAAFLGQQETQLQMVPLGPRGLAGNRVVSFRRKDLPTRLSWRHHKSGALLGWGREEEGGWGGSWEGMSMGCWKAPAGEEWKCHLAAWQVRIAPLPFSVPATGAPPAQASLRCCTEAGESDVHGSENHRAGLSSSTSQ